MRTSIIALALLTLLWAAPARAHSLFFSLVEDGENTIELAGAFSDGTLAMGIPVKIYGKEGGALLWQGRTDEFGLCLFERPGEPYEVELDAGPGHRVREDGI
jgi:hypothetical protein